MTQARDELGRLAAKVAAGEELTFEEIEASLALCGPEAPPTEDAVRRIWNKVKAKAAREGWLRELAGADTDTAVPFLRVRAAAAGPTSRLGDREEHPYLLGELGMGGVVYQFWAEGDRVLLSPAPPGNCKFFYLDARVYPVHAAAATGDRGEVEGLCADEMASVFDDLKLGVKRRFYELR